VSSGASSSRLWLAAPPQPVDAEVNDESIEPGGEPSLAPVGAQCAQESDEGILGQVGRIGRVADNRHGDAVDVPLLGIDEVGDGPAVARLGAEDRVAGWFGHATSTSSADMTPSRPRLLHARARSERWVS